MSTPDPSGVAMLPPPVHGVIEAAVTGIVDGDTLEVIINGQRTTVDLLGIDAPEVQNGDQEAQCYGTDAMARTWAFVDLAGRRALLEGDAAGATQGDHVLRYVWLALPDGTQLLNGQLVMQGYARLSTDHDTGKYQDWLSAAERAARDQGAGLWSACRGA